MNRVGEFFFELMIIGTYLPDQLFVYLVIFQTTSLRVNYLLTNNFGLFDTEHVLVFLTCSERATRTYSYMNEEDRRT